MRTSIALALLFVVTSVSIVRHMAHVDIYNREDSFAVGYKAYGTSYGFEIGASGDGIITTGS